MKRPLFYLIILVAVLLQSCDETTFVGPGGPTPLPPDTSFAGVDFSVGNKYHWRYTRFYSTGTFFQWDDSLFITGETTIGGERYFVFSTGEILRNSHDTVYAYANDSVSVYYRLNPSVGQAVPFLGYSMTVTSVDTGTIFGKTLKMITVSTMSASPSGMDLARYATRFGPLETNQSEHSYVTRGILLGARLGSVMYGY